MRPNLRVQPELGTVMVLGLGLLISHEVLPMIHANPQPAPKVPPRRSTPTSRSSSRILHGEVGPRRRVHPALQENHYPVLKKQVERGRMLHVFAAKPRYHATEDGRWDYPGDHRLQERGGGICPGRRGRRDQAGALPRPGDVQTRRSAPGSRSSRPTGTCRSTTSRSSLDRDGPGGSSAISSNSPARAERHLPDGEILSHG